MIIINQVEVVWDRTSSENRRKIPKDINTYMNVNKRALQKALYTTYSLGKGWEPVMEFSTVLRRRGIHVFRRSFIITLWHACKNIVYIFGSHAMLQELHLRTARTFHFDPTKVVLIKLLVLHWLHVWLVKKKKHQQHRQIWLFFVNPLTST